MFGHVRVTEQSVTNTAAEAKTGMGARAAMIGQMTVTAVRTVVTGTVGMREETASGTQRSTEAVEETETETGQATGTEVLAAAAADRRRTKTESGVAVENAGGGRVQTTVRRTEDTSGGTLRKTAWRRSRNMIGISGGCEAHADCQPL